LAILHSQTNRASQYIDVCICSFEAEGIESEFTEEITDSPGSFSPLHEVFFPPEEGPIALPELEISKT